MKHEDYDLYADTEWMNLRAELKRASESTSNIEFMFSEILNGLVFGLIIGYIIKLL